MVAWFGVSNIPNSKVFSQILESVIILVTAHTEGVWCLVEIKGMNRTNEMAK